MAINKNVVILASHGLFFFFLFMCSLCCCFLCGLLFFFCLLLFFLGGCFLSKYHGIISNIEVISGRAFINLSLVSKSRYSALMQLSWSFLTTIHFKIIEKYDDFGQSELFKQLLIVCIYSNTQSQQKTVRYCAEDNS